MAETTTSTPCPWRFAAITRSATLRMRSASATEVPPYFWTITDMARAPRSGRRELFPALQRPGRGQPGDVRVEQQAAPQRERPPPPLGGHGDTLQPAQHDQSEQAGRHR